MSIFINATGMIAQQQNVDTISNNLANVNTTSYKRSRAEFQDLFYQTVRAPGAESAVGQTIPAGLQYGRGVALTGISRDFTQGSITSTGNPFDIAIEGNGFFQVIQPDGEIGYTRDGSFEVNQDGDMVTTDGFLLEPNITVPSDSVAVSIGIDGTVTATLSDATVVDLGQIELALFVNPAGLFAEGRNTYSETESSGPPIVTTPTQDGAGNLRQAFLEGSNVEIVTEIVDLIVAQRAFEVNANALRTSDEMLQTTGALLQ